LKRLDFNKGLNVLGYLVVENESWVDMSWIFHVKGWSVYGLKRLATTATTLHQQLLGDGQHSSCL